MDQDWDVRCGITMNGKRLEPGDRPIFRTMEHPKPNKPERWYRTVFFAFHGSGKQFVTYKSSPFNALRALKRVLGQRKNEQVLDLSQLMLAANLGFLESFVKMCPRLRNTQYDVISIPPVVLEHVSMLIRRCERGYLQYSLDAICNTKRWAYYSLYTKYLELKVPFVSRGLTVDLVHVKRKLRQKYYSRQLIHSDANVMVKKVTLKFKREFAKCQPDKPGRLYADYGAACIYAAELPDLIKKCWTLPFVYYESNITCEVQIITAPDLMVIQQVFTKCRLVMSTPGSIYFAMFSDDSVCCGNVRGKSFGFNIDIKSCDKSNRELAFGLVHTSMSQFTEVRATGLVEQCCKPLVMPNPYDPDEVLTFVLDHPYEGSGTTLTTILNNAMSSIIAASTFALIVNDFNSMMSIEECIMKGAAYVGHLVSIEDASAVFEKLQFLKHSPSVTGDGIVLPYLNLGVLFRSLGSVAGDLSREKLGVTPAEFVVMPVYEKVDRFVSGVVNGWVHQPSHRLIDALRRRFNYNTKAIHLNWLSEQLEQEGFSDFEVPENSILNRYDITDSDITFLVSHISQMSVGKVSITIAATQFFLVDYGLSTEPDSDGLRPVERTEEEEKE
jgi:hypothetical protein